MKYIYPSIIAALLIYVIFLQQCQQPKVITNTDTVTITKVDTVKIVGKTIVKKITDVRVDTAFSTDTIIKLQQCDSLIKEHFTIREYKRRIDLDSIGYVDLTDTVYMNKLKVGDYKAYAHVYTTIKYITPPDKLKLIVGLKIAYPSDLYPSIMVGKNKKYYSVSYSPFTKSFQAGIYWQIK